MASLIDMQPLIRRKTLRVKGVRKTLRLLAPHAPAKPTVMRLRDILRQRLIDALSEQRFESQTDLARRAKLSEGTVRQVLDPEGPSPKLSTIEKLAAALDVTPVELLGGSGAPNRNLLLAVSGLVLETAVPNPLERSGLAEALVHAYEVAQRQKVAPDNQRELRLVTASSDRPTPQSRRPQ